MTEFNFTLLEKNYDRRKSLNHLINRLLGDFTAIETKDGAAYLVSFDSDTKAAEFKKEANLLILELV